MRGIWRKALADLRGRPLQSVLLFLVIASAAATLSLALNVASSASEPYERLRDESNGADLWVTTAGAGTELTRLKTMQGVATTGEPYPVSWENYGIRKGDKKQQLALVGMGATLPEFDHPVVTKGEWLSSGGRDEIVVDAGAASVLKLKVGEKVDLLVPGGAVRQFTVVGFAVTAGRNPAPISDPAFAFILPETLQSITPGVVYGGDDLHSLRIGVKLTNPDDPYSFLPPGRPIPLGGPVNIRVWQDVREVSKETNQFDVIFLNVFSVFALFAAGLIVANTIGGQVLSQLRDTGVLKAIGFTPRQITASLLLQNLSLSLVAGIVGVLVRLLVSPVFLERSASLLGVPATPAFNPPRLAIALAVIMFLVGLFTFVPAWRAGRVSAITALSSGNEVRSLRPSKLAALLVRLGLPRVAVIGIKDLPRRPVRTTMTIAALVLAVVTATFSLGIEATLDKTMSDPTVIGGPPYNINADRDAYPDAQARAILDSRPEVESYLVRYTSGGRIGMQGFDIRGYDGDLNKPRWAVREGRMPTAAGEAAVSSQLANKLGVKVGDTITPLIGPRDGTPLTLKIVGRYIDADGENLIVSKESLPASAEITDYLIRTVPGTDDHAFAEALITASGGNLDPEILSDTIGEIRDQFRSVLLSLNLVLFFIAGLNLLASLLLSIRERRRDFAVLKTLGFTPGQIGQSVFAGSVSLSIIALVVGLPLGLVATRVMFDILTSAAGIGTGVGEMPGILWLAPLVPGAVLVAVLATVLPAQRAAGVQVAEALRYE